MKDVADELKMEHEIEDGRVSIVKIVNPCLYWIRCRSCFSISEMEDILKNSTLIQATNIERGNRLVVKFFDGLFRAVVQCPVSYKFSKKEVIHYRVFLMDLMDIVVVQQNQLYRVNGQTSLDDVGIQLHLIGIEFGRGVGTIESGVYLDEDSHLEAQRKEIYTELEQYEGVEFQAKRKCESVTLGKMKLVNKQKHQNLLRFLVDRRLAQYNENMMSMLNMSEWMDKVLDELKVAKDLLFPPPEKKPEKVVSRKLSPPPPVVFDQDQVNHLKNITKYDSTNLLDKIVPNPIVESFEEMNQRYRRLSKYEAVMRKNAAACREQKFEYISDSCSLAGGFVDVEVKTNKDPWICPPTSSETSCTSSNHPASSIDSSIHDSDTNDGGVSSSEPELPTKNNHVNNLEFVGDFGETPELKRSEKLIYATNQDTSSDHLDIKKICFGRGHVFQKYLPSRILPKLTEGVVACNNVVHAAGQYDDADNEVMTKKIPRVCNPILDDSAIDFMNGFLDESYDSEVQYGDLLRMNKNKDFVSSLATTRPAKSSPDASLQHPTPVPPDEIQAGELSPVESVPSVSLSRSSSVSSSVNLPSLLPINRRRAKKERKLPNSRSESDSTDSSHEISNVATNNDLQPAKDNINGSVFPKRTLSIIGRGKFVEEHRDPRRVLAVPSSSGSAEEAKITNDVELKKLMDNGTIIPTNVGVQNSGPVKGFGRGIIFKTPKLLQTSPLLPTVNAKWPLQKSEVEKTELDSNQSPKIVQSISACSRQIELEEACRNMSIQKKSEDTDSSETESFSQLQSKPLLTEFVEGSDVQESISTSDGEEEYKISERLPPNLGHTYIDKEDHALKITSGILHGATGILPAKYLSGLDIDELILRNARFHKVDFLTRPQYYGIPAILERKNVVFVSPNKSKKSSAFVIPLLSLLMDGSYYSTLRKGNGPRCVFVAPTSDRVKTLGRLCSTFCGSRLVTIITYGGGLELERKNDLADGCDILITTPRCWLRLLQYPTVTNLSRLCHLVLDRFDVLSHLFSPELKKISHKLVELTNVRTKKNEAFSSMAVQMILSSEQWSPAVEQVVTKLLKNPVVVITSYLEAIIYSRIKPKVTLVKSSARLSKLVDLVDTHSSEKVVIVCVTPEEVTEVRKACSAKYISIVAHENMARSLITEVNSQWNKSKLPPKLICSDAVIYDLGITDAQVLIHFSLPENKTKFSERFVVLRDHIPDRILNQNVAPPKAVVHIMFDEACEAPFPSIVDYLSRISVNIPEKAFIVAKNLERKKEENKTAAPFCENILQMGSCYKVSSCQSRHVVLTDLDSPKNHLMSYGLIKVQIVHVHSAVKFSARILAHNPNVTGSGAWTKYKSEFTTLTLELGSYYATLANRRQHGRPKEGDLVAYQEDADRPFFRARVLKVTQRNHHQEPTEVLLFLLDEGIEKKSLIHSLIELPEHLKKYPDQAVYIYLANLKPVDLDTTWSYAAKKVVDKAVHRSEIEDVANQDIVGKVLFSIGRSCVVENLRWCLHMKYNQCFTLDLRQLILNSGCGIDNKDYSSNLADLCSSSNMMRGLFYSGDETTSTSDDKLVEEAEQREPPRWAHLPRDEGFVKINTMVDESPSLFYVKISENHRKLEELESDLSTYMNENKVKKKNPRIGSVCAVQWPKDSLPEKKWNRCIIYEISGKEAEIFLSTMETEKPCNSRISTRSRGNSSSNCLSRQSSANLQVSSQVKGKKQWSEDAMNGFHDLISKNSCMGEFYIKVIDLDLKATRTGGRCYHVILLDVEGDSPVLINRLLIDMGHGFLSSLVVDEDELIDVYNKIKNYEEKEDADDECEYDDDVEDEDWDAPTAVSPSPASNSLPVEEDESSYENFNIENVDMEELMNFMRLLDPRCAALFDASMPPKPPLLPITAGPAKEDDLSGESAPNTSSQGDKEHLGEVPAASEFVSQLTDHLDDADRPLLVRCAPLKTPFIHWRQDESTIIIKYMIPCLEKYKIDVSPFSVTFSAIIDSESGSVEYWNRINFFGPVLDNTISEALTVTCLRLKVSKRIQGYLWPRLTHNDTRNHRIKLDPEHETLTEDRNFIKEIVDEAHSRVSKGNRRRKTFEKTLERVVAESSEDEEDDDEYFEPDDNEDPFNPFS
ncbi:hypothetical protein GE061_009350 [Apolygus lucorum]|uniref:RNA helicase n=1 Tax=Apolygus lucorum TaxID=248454 RepID=A0A8S9Y089_APOLU|nr:hypothetical protein GE061_009350 [Apolygus lucorum]